MTRFDVGIVGAGPAGLAAAIHLRKLGVEKVALVDRQDFPRDKTCGSAISPKGIEALKTLDVFETVSGQGCWVNGMRLVTPTGHDVRLVGQSDAALILLRRVFDEILLRKAKTLGITFLPNVHVDHLLTKDERTIGFQARDGIAIRSNITVVADGAKSPFGLDRGPRRMLQTIMGWWDDFEHEPHEIEMIFSPLVRPLYGWLFPEGDGRVNIGICYEDPDLSRKARILFQQFLDRHFASRVARARPCGPWKGHPISYGINVGRLTSPGRFVTGEAGRMTHPATGEGIYQAMTSGIAAAEAIAAILLRGEPELQAAKTYEATCRKAFGLSFRVGMGWRRLVDLGGLDLAARAASLPFVQKHLAGTMAHM